MRLRLISCSVLLISGLASVGSALAASSALFGQQHAYSVTLRGNGEAVVAARLVFTNHAATPQTTFDFSVPGVTPQELDGYQQIITPTPCASIAIYPPVSQPCLPVEPDYTQATLPYGGGESSYSHATIAQNGSNYRVTLPNVVQPEKSSALIISYTAKGYVTSSWGRLEYRFRTLTVGERVTTTTIAVSTDSNLYLEGIDSKVNYTSTSGGTAANLGADIAAKAASAPSELSQIAGNIGHDGPVSRSARDLAANESFSVTGAYADAAWKLNLSRYAWAAGILALFIFIIVVLVALARRRPHLPDSPASWQDFFAALPVVSGLVTALAIGGLAWGIVSYTADATQPLDSFSTMMLTVFGVLMFLIVAIGPAIWIGGARRQWRSAGLSVIWEAIGLLVLLSIYTAVLRPGMTSTISATDIGGPVVYPMSAGSSGASTGSSGTATGSAGSPEAVAK